ncbi:putative mitochondrial import inner membrane translocase subunit Tim8 A-B [Clavelina lepadiformis]|uniref:Mitochondrial import inner membrane translocase subunit n=1 Tax=Clavelina lepadiformis TaxID=159417 RepID=A0ABP0FEX3_CLALP
MDTGVFEEVAKQLKDNPQLARMLMEEQKKLEAQVQLKTIVNKLSVLCWDKCVDKVGTSLGRQETCLANCAERYLDVDQFIRQRMSGQKK